MKGAVRSFQLRNILDQAHRETLKDRGKAYQHAKMGRVAMRHAVANFRTLPGVEFKKRNVRTLARAFQEHQVRNHASFIATFEACAQSPETDLRLPPHLFGMMDMVGITVEQKADSYAFTTQNEASAIVFCEKIPFSFKLMLCQFFDGTVADPVFLVTDKSMDSDSILKVEVPTLSPYGNGKGHVWVATSKGGGNNTFYREYLQAIAIPAFRSKAATFQELQPVRTKRQRLQVHPSANAPETSGTNAAAAVVGDMQTVPQEATTTPLAKNSIALLGFDGEISQVTEATSRELQPMLSAALLDLWKIPAGLSFCLSSCDAGRTHSVLHMGARLLRSPEKPSYLSPNLVLFKLMMSKIKDARKKLREARFVFCVRLSPKSDQ
jgi:hypothetical protein